MWRTPKPVIAQVHGWCVGGGSDFALCADLMVASEDAVIGTPYSRMWGLPVGHVDVPAGPGPRQVPRTDRSAAVRPGSGDVELINEAVPFAELESTVAALAEELASIPLSQLTAMKLVLNHAYENMGLASTQTLGPILDGLMRNTPEARSFIKTAEREARARSSRTATARLATTAWRRRSCGRTRRT